MLKSFPSVLLHVLLCIATHSTTSSHVERIEQQFHSFRQRALENHHQNCSVPMYSSVQEGVNNIIEFGDHPFVVRGIDDPIQLSKKYNVNHLVQHNGHRINHYGRLRNAEFESLKEGWQKLSDICAERRCLGTMPVTNGAVLVGMVQTLKEREFFDYVFKPTSYTQNGGHHLQSGYDEPNVKLGMVFGKQGCGVFNDDHISVWFYHLKGRKVWSFTVNPIHSEYPRQSFCDDGIFQQGNNSQVCVLEGGDFLYAPAGLYHTTCHLDDDSITLIQWDDERRLYDDESDIWKKENIDEL